MLLLDLIKIELAAGGWKMDGWEDERGWQDGEIEGRNVSSLYHYTHKIAQNRRFKMLMCLDNNVESNPMTSAQLVRVRAVSLGYPVDHPLPTSASTLIVFRYLSLET
jgi:hypothetical protein